jgi:hypothetical protein
METEKSDWERIATEDRKGLWACVGCSVLVAIAALIVAIVALSRS